VADHLTDGPQQLFDSRFALLDRDGRRLRAQLRSVQSKDVLLKVLSLKISLLHPADLNLVDRYLVYLNLGDLSPHVKNHRDKKLNLNGHLSVRLDGTNYYLQASLLLFTLKVTAI
jgi:hypothetical protein